MANGISIGKVSEDKFREKDLDDKLWMLYMASEYQQRTLDEIKSNCNTRLTTCKTNIKKGRLKNVSVQAVSGAVGGLSAFGGLYIVYLKPLIDRMQDLIDKALK